MNQYYLFSYSNPMWWACNIDWTSNSASLARQLIKQHCESGWIGWQYGLLKYNYFLWAEMFWTHINIQIDLPAPWHYIFGANHQRNGIIDDAAISQQPFPLTPSSLKHQEPDTAEWKATFTPGGPADYLQETTLETLKVPQNHKHSRNC